MSAFAVGAGYVLRLGGATEPDDRGKRGPLCLRGTVLEAESHLPGVPWTFSGL